MPSLRKPFAGLLLGFFLLAGCTGPGQDAVDPTGPGRGFPDNSPWVSFYGNAEQMGDLGRVAATFRIINIDADPGAGNFTPEQIAQLKAGGKNRVISYFNLGSIESGRDYWSTVPAGFVAPEKMPHLGPYQGYPDEVWMDPGNPGWQRLVVDYLAPRLVAQGVDGFYFDNLELVEHGTTTDNGPCDAACSQGGLRLVKRLRDKYPNLLFVMQNATGSVTRQGLVDGIAFASLLDGVAHEEVFTAASSASNASEQSYSLQTNDQVVGELAAWQALGLRPGGRPFWIGTEDYANSCTNSAIARRAYDLSRARGFSPYVSDKSAGQNQVCFWGF